MTRTIIRVCVGLAALGAIVITGAVVLHLIATPVAAQQRDTSRTGAQADTGDRPFVRGGVYDKPFENRLGSRTAFGGYAEAHARYERADGANEESGFVAKRFNLFASARVSDVVRFASELEFEEGGEEVKVEFAAIDLRIHPSLAFRAGMILSPLGRFNLSHDSPLNEFTDRPLVSTELIGVALSEPGFGALGQFRVGSGGRVTYEVYATNGFNDGLITNAEDGTRLPLGRGNFEDNNASPAFVGRVAWSPRPALELGVSAHHGAYNVFETEGVIVDDRRNATVAVVDFDAMIGGTRVQGEAARATVQIPPGLAGIYSGSQRGIFVEAIREFGRGLVRTLPASTFAAKVRWDAVDFNTALPGDSRIQFTAGVNFRPTAESVLKLDYVRGRVRDDFNNLGNRAALLLSLATYF
ncbi:MAG: hypothetical protein O2973_05680 [Gemmatimonadetes bacterium]|nr:hypothetical protein [Gemmatimonadota bacterium]